MRVEKRGLWCLLLGLAIMLSGLFASHLVHAQVASSSVRGIIRDEAGAGAPGAEVVLKNEDTATERTTHSRGDGTYVFTPVAAGTYTLRVRLKGFVPAGMGHLAVPIGQDVVANFSLQGEKGEGETSSSAPAPPPPAAPNAYVYGVMPSERVTALPSVNRNYSELVEIFAGVTRPQETHTGLATNGAFIASGVGFAHNNYLLDGVDNNNRTVDFLTGTPSAVLPAEDGVQEFRLQSGDYGPALGGSAGAVINTNTRSGSNQIHGNVWEFYGNDAFNASDFFDNASNVNVAPMKKNQFGAAIGGPLTIPNFYNGKNKTFLFVDYQGTRMHLGVPETTTVPTLAERSSGFTNYSDLLTAQPNCTRGADLLGRTFNCGTILDPATTRLVILGGVDPVTGGTATGTGYVRDPFQGNILPGTRVDPTGAALLGLFPAPTRLGIYDNYTTNAYRSQNDNSYDVRLDHTIGTRDHAFARVSYDDTPIQQDGPFTVSGGGGGVADGGGYTQLARSYNIALNETHTISANTVNDFRVGYTHVHASRAQPFASDLNNIPEQHGIAAIPQVIGNGGLPTLDVGIYSPLGSSPFLYADDHDATIQVVDNVSKVVGSQIWHFGGEARYLRTDTVEPPYSRGKFTFSGNFTSIPNILDASTGAAQLVLAPTATTVPNGVNDVGGPNQVLASNISNIADRRYYLAGYFNDDWRVDPKLTVNLGVRWDWVGPTWENYGDEAKFVPGPIGSAQYEIPDQAAMKTTAGLTPAQPFPLSTPFTNALTNEQIKLAYVHRGQLMTVSKKNISPRLGLAYQLTPKLVIRAGGGMYYDGLQNEGVLSNLGGNYPFQLNYAFNSPNDAQPIIFPYSGSYATIEQGLVGVTLQVPTADPNNMVLRSYQTAYQTPYAISARASAAYQLGEDTAVELAYAGSIGHHLPVNPGGNLPTEILRPGETAQSFAPYPTFAYDSSFLQTEGASYSHSGSVTVTHRFSHGLNALANYTYSDTRTDARDLIFPGGEQPYRAPYLSDFGINKDYGWANFEVRHAVHVSGSYDLPAGKGRRYFSGGGIITKVLGDWSLHWVFTLQSGLPVTIPCDITTSAGEGCYALLVGNPGGGSANKFWSAAAFANPVAAASTGQLNSSALPDVSVLGGAPGQAFGPGIKRLDLSIHKDIRLSERTRVEFRVEGFNVMNHPNFAAPSVLNFSDPTNFGLIGATRDNPYDPRQIQFALRINF